MRRPRSNIYRWRLSAPLERFLYRFGLLFLFGAETIGWVSRSVALIVVDAARTGEKVAKGYLF